MKERFRGTPAVWFTTIEGSTGLMEIRSAAGSMDVRPEKPIETFTHWPAVHPSSVNDPDAGVPSENENGMEVTENTVRMATVPTITPESSENPSRLCCRCSVVVGIVLRWSFYSKR
jgi:hypothetical protein